MDFYCLGLYLTTTDTEPCPDRLLVSEQVDDHVCVQEVFAEIEKAASGERAFR